MSTIKLDAYPHTFLQSYLERHIYLGHKETVNRLVKEVADLASEAQTHISYTTIQVDDQYAATIHRRGLKILFLSDVRNSTVFSRIALKTAIPDGGQTEYIVGFERVCEPRNIDTALMRNGFSPAGEGGGGIDRDDFRMWLTLNGGVHIGEAIWRSIEAPLIEKQCLNLPLRFRQSNYRRCAGYMKSGCIKVDIVIPPSGERLATLKIRTVQLERPARRERLDIGDFSFEFNPKAFTLPEEARNMQSNIEITSQEPAANMMQVGAGLDYLPIWAALDVIRTWSEFDEWLHSNTKEEQIEALEQHLKNLDVEGLFDGFRFKEVKHPALQDVIAGETVFGDITFECLKDGVYGGCDITFIIGTVKKEDSEGHYEMIVGWPEGAVLKIEGETTTQVELDKKVAPAPEKFRIGSASLFATNGNQREPGAIRRLPISTSTLSTEDFVLWFANNATPLQGLNNTEKIRKLVADVRSAAHAGAERRFFIHSISHAVPATSFAGRTGNDVKGSIDVDVVVPVESRPGEFEQIGLFSFTTIAQQVPGTAEMAEFVDTYVHPEHRGVVSVGFDSDQVYTFNQVAELFSEYDKTGAANLLSYQSATRNLLRRLYPDNINPTLYLKPMRSSQPHLRADGTVEPGVITFYVFDSYAAVDKQERLLSFALLTGLTSDRLSNRYMEIIQGVECPAADILKKRLEEGKEDARVSTLKELGLMSGGEADNVPPLTAEQRSSQGAYERNRETLQDTSQASLDRLSDAIAQRQEEPSRGTKFESDLFLIFRATLIGITPMLTATESGRVHDFLDYIQPSYDPMAAPATFSFGFVEHHGLTIDIVEQRGNKHNLTLVLK